MIKGSAWRARVTAPKKRLLEASSGAALTVMLLTMATSPARAQTVAAPPTSEADSGVAPLDEIIVTARKQEESLNDVPLAVSAFNDAQLAARNITSLNDISTFTPSFNFQNQQGGGSGRNDRTLNTLTFRGLVLTTDNGVRAGGLLFIDGAPVVSGTAPGLADIERVEVLKGPQSAFFGRSTFSGAVNYVTKDPPRDAEGRIGLTVETRDSYIATASVGGPIAGEALRGRISFYNEEQGGHWRNAAAPFEELGKRRTTSIGGQLLWDASDRLRIKGAVTAFEQKDGPPAQAALKQADMNCNLNPPTVPASFRLPAPVPGNPQIPNPNAGNRYFCGSIPDADDLAAGAISGNYVIDPITRASTLDNRSNFITHFDPDFLGEGGLRRHSLQGSIRLDYDLANGMTFSAVTAAHTEKVQSLIDLSFRDGRPIPNPLFTPGSTTRLPFISYFLNYQTKGSDFSQEIRLTSEQDGRFRWLIGGNYIEADQYDGVIFGQSPFGPLFVGQPSHFSPRTPAVFGAAYFDVTPSLTLSAELRYQRDMVRQDVLGTALGAPLADPVRLKENYNSLSPRLTVDYEFESGTMVYALWSRGYRPGGFNVQLAPGFGAGPELLAAAAGGGYALAFDQERLDNYEAGIKASLFDRRAQLNISAYYDEYSKGQIGQNVTFARPNGTIGLANLVGNVGRIELKGIEIDAAWRPARSLQLSATFAINDSEVKRGFCSDCVGISSASQGIGLEPPNNDLRGKRLPVAPKYSGTFGAEYEQPLAGAYDWFTRLDYIYRGKRFIDQANVAAIGAKSTLNLRIGVRSERLSAELYCSNCTNDLTMASATYGSDAFTLTSPPTRQEIRLGLPQRRVFGVRASYNF
jgi:iron complex outermembrane recepter protein